MSVPTVGLVNSDDEVPDEGDDTDTCADGIVKQHLLQQPSWDFRPFGHPDDEQVVEDGVDDISSAGNDTLLNRFDASRMNVSRWKKGVERISTRGLQIKPPTMTVTRTRHGDDDGRTIQKVQPTRSPHKFIPLSK